MIFMPWIDGKEEVLIDGKPALLGRCKLTCGYNGAIEIYTDGVCEDGTLNSVLFKTTYNLTWEGISVNHTFAGKYQIIEKEYIKEYLYFDPWGKIW